MAVKHKCDHIGCFEKENTLLCKYCKKYFCAFHVVPKPLKDLEFQVAEPEQHNLIEKFDTLKGHFCKEYLDYSLSFDQAKKNLRITGDFISDDEEVKRKILISKELEAQRKRKLVLAGLSIFMLVIICCFLLWQTGVIELPFFPRENIPSDYLTPAEKVYLDNAFEWSSSHSFGNITIITKRFGHYSIEQGSKPASYLRVDISIKYSGVTQGYIILTSPGIIDPKSKKIKFASWSSVNSVRLAPNQTVDVSLIYGNGAVYNRNSRFNVSIARHGTSFSPEAYSVDVSEIH